MTFESLKKLIEKELEKTVGGYTQLSPLDLSGIASKIVDKVKEKGGNESSYTFIILGAYEENLLKEEVSGDKLEINEYNYTVYSDDEIVFSIPQENVVYVKKGWCLIEYILSNV